MARGTRGRFRSFALALVGRFRPAAPVECEQPTGVGAARFDQRRTIPRPRAGHPNPPDRHEPPEKRLGVGLPHGIEGMVELGSRGQLELVRAGSDLPPSMGLDQPPDGARHFTN